MLGWFNSLQFSGGLLVCPMAPLTIFRLNIKWLGFHHLHMINTDLREKTGEVLNKLLVKIKKKQKEKNRKLKYDSSEFIIEIS